MQFLILGTLAVRAYGREVPISAPRQRIVLATLLLNPNRVVAVDRIARFVWDGSPPPSAIATIRTYVMRLRQVLGDLGVRIATRAPGYLIELSEDETDLGKFMAHRRAASQLVEAGDLSGAVRELERGLVLWRHEPLLDVPSRDLHDTEVNHLRQLRLQTVAWRIDLCLELDRHAEVLPELWRLVADDPVDEAFVSRLMLALSRAGRQSEALELFQRTRAMLIDEFGAEPGSELSATQRRILRGEDERPTPLIGPHPHAPTASGVPHHILPRPAQIPSDLPDFTARAGQLDELTRLLRASDTWARLGAPVVVTGRGGIGKSALAVHAAHAVRDHFEDGQLYADLTGTADRPVETADVLSGFLVALGVPPAAVPSTLLDRAALYRSVIATRRLLLLVDNARSAAQVRPLIPGIGDSRLVITSRGRLAGLEGVHTLDLPALGDRDALELLGRIAGRQRIAAQAQAARQLIGICAGMPLAIRIVGLRLLERPRWSLDRLLRRLSDPRQVLDELRVGDLSVRRTLDDSHARVASMSTAVDLPRAFRILDASGLVCLRPDPAAALLACSPHEAEDVLDALADAHLLREYGGVCYHFDPLLRAYARELADREPLAVSSA